MTDIRRTWSEPVCWSSSDGSTEPVVHFEGGWQWTLDTREPLPRGDYETPAAVGYVCAVDRDARTVTVSSARVEAAVADLDVPYWLYHFAVELGAQPPVVDIWPEPAIALGRRWGKSILPDLLATHFYASKPPDP